MLNIDLRQLFDSLCCFKHDSIHSKCHSHSKHDVFLMLLGKAALPPPADVGWSINNGGISAVGRCRLEYELQKILTIGWGINYISHCYPLCAFLLLPPSILIHLICSTNLMHGLLSTFNVYSRTWIYTSTMRFREHNLSLKTSHKPSLASHEQVHEPLT